MHVWDFLSWVIGIRKKNCKPKRARTTYQSKDFESVFWPKRKEKPT